MGFFNSDEKTEVNAEDKVVQMPNKKPFQTWEVGGESYKLKLETAGISELEQKYKTNLMNVMGTGSGGMPALTVMLDVAHVALRKYHHGIKREAMNQIFDKYLEEGGSQLNFYTEIYMGIFTVSGFFSTSLANQMEGAIEEAAQEIL